MNSLRVCITSDIILYIITVATYYVRCTSTSTRGSGGSGERYDYVI